MNPLRFGVHVHTHTSREGWFATCRTAEELGYSVVTVPDHIGPEGGVWAALASATAVTERLRVGTLVLNNDYWNPAVLAREAATTDLLSGGRLELGIGAGWNRADYAATGMAMDSPGTRIARLAETVQILRSGFDGKPVHHSGRFFTLDGDAPWCAPAQQPLPLLIGGGGRKVLTLAGSTADIVSINRNLRTTSAGPATAVLAAQQGLYEQDLRDKLSWVAAGAAGRAVAPELHTFVLRTIVTNDRRRAAEDVGRAYGIGSEDALASPHFLIGTPAQIADDLLERREHFGFSYFTVREESLTEFAAVIAEISGRAA
ncbi:MAG: putative oxidoreductase [Frankiales bacterium]|nr:putative oxidoreductase [Frankiales bacterium]